LFFATRFFLVLSLPGRSGTTVRPFIRGVIFWVGGKGTFGDSGHQHVPHVSSCEQFQPLVKFLENSSYIEKGHKQVVNESKCHNVKNGHDISCNCGKCPPYAVHAKWKYKDSSNGK
jgi:hypothetical protein